MRTLVLATVGLVGAVLPVVAQPSLPTVESDPAVYKVVFEDANFRVIAATWKAGETDKPHSHPNPSVTIALTDCTLKLSSADGKTNTVNPKAGGASLTAMTPSHTAQNVGPSECRVMLVERK